jgi:hypothetical protein
VPLALRIADHEEGPTTALVTVTTFHWSHA